MAMRAMGEFTMERILAERVRRIDAGMMWEPRRGRQETLDFVSDDF